MESEQVNDGQLPVHMAHISSTVWLTCSFTNYCSYCNNNQISSSSVNIVNKQRHIQLFTFTANITRVWNNTFDMYQMANLVWVVGCTQGWSAQKLALPVQVGIYSCMIYAVQ